MTPLVQRLLALKYVSRVDTQDLHLDEEEEALDEDGVGMVAHDVPPEEAGSVSGDTVVLAEEAASAKVRRKKIRRKKITPEGTSDDAEGGSQI